MDMVESGKRRVVAAGGKAGAVILHRHDRPSWPSRIATWIVCTCLGAGFGVLVMLWMAGVG